MPGLPLATTHLGLQQLVGRKKRHRFCRASLHCWNTVPSFPACHKLASYTTVKPKYYVLLDSRTYTEIFLINGVIFSSNSDLLQFLSSKSHPSTACESNIREKMMTWICLSRVGRKSLDQPPQPVVPSGKVRDQSVSLVVGSTEQT